MSTCRGRATSKQNPLDPRGPAHPRSCRPSELLHEPVIAPATADTALRAERVARELEHCAGVVVQPTH